MGDFRGAPFNTFLLILGLAIAATFYIAASVTFPRLSEDSSERVDLNTHFWDQRRVVFSCIMAANLIVAVLLILLSLGNENFAKIAASPRLWIGTGIFVICAATAAFAPNRKLVSAALVTVLLYSLWGLANAAALLIRAGGWAPALGVT